MHYAIYLFTFIVECIWSHIENIKSKIKTNHNIDIWTPTMLRCMWLFGHWRANDKLHFPLSPLSMADRVDSEIILFLISFLDRHNGGSIVAWCMYVHLYASNRLCMARMCTYIYIHNLIQTWSYGRTNGWGISVLGRYWSECYSTGTGFHANEIEKEGSEKVSKRREKNVTPEYACVCLCEWECIQVWYLGVQVLGDYVCVCLFFRFNRFALDVCVRASVWCEMRAHIFLYARECVDFIYM